jgi:outer membrane murein-binding lipoprotein Lpp
MHLSRLKAGTTVSALVAFTLLSGCVNVSSLDCNEIAEQAKTISQAQDIKIQSVTNSRETSRNGGEARCTADATLSDGRNTTLYLRAYEENGNTMVAYQETEFQ